MMTVEEVKQEGLKAIKEKLNSSSNLSADEIKTLVNALRELSAIF